MFNRLPKYCLPICVVVFSVFLISACTESNYHGEKVAQPEVESSVSNEALNLSEYIIVLEENVSIESATSIFEKYEGQVIRDLKKGRYLIRLKNDPGIEQLQKDVQGSELIKHIQPNYTYTIQ